jgi:hypothetical protein
MGYVLPMASSTLLAGAAFTGHSGVLSHKFLVFQSSQNSPVQDALRRQYLDIGQERNAVMADSVISRRARPVRLLAVLRPLPMERPLPADRAYPEALQAALKC